MRNNNGRQVRILSSESYAQSKERMERLQNIIIEGEEAKVVLKYAERFLAEIERETLDNLKKNIDHKEAADTYRAAVRFTDMLKAAISLGEQKIETFEKLKRNS